MPGNRPTRCNHPHPEGSGATCEISHGHLSDHAATVNDMGAPRRVTWRRSTTVPNDDDAHGTVHVTIPFNLEPPCTSAWMDRNRVRWLCAKPEGHIDEHRNGERWWTRDRPVPDTLPVTPRMPPLHIDRDMLAVHVRADVRVVALLDDDEVASLDLGSVSVADPDRIPGDLATLLRGALRLLEPDERVTFDGSTTGARNPVSVAPPASLVGDLADLVGVEVRREPAVPMIDLADGRSVPRAGVEALEALDETWPGLTAPSGRPAIVAAVLAAVLPAVTPSAPFDMPAAARRYAATVQRVQDKVAPVLVEVRPDSRTRWGYHAFSELFDDPVAWRMAIDHDPRLTVAGRHALPEHEHKPVQHDEPVRGRHRGGVWCDVCGAGTGLEPRVFDLVRLRELVAPPLVDVEDEAPDPATPPVLATAGTGLGMRYYRTWQAVIAARDPRPTLTDTGWETLPVHDHACPPHGRPCAECGLSTDGVVMLPYVLAKLLGEPVPMGKL